MNSTNSDLHIGTPGRKGAPRKRMKMLNEKQETLYKINSGLFKGVNCAHVEARGKEGGRSAVLPGS